MVAIIILGIGSFFGSFFLIYCFVHFCRESSSRGKPASHVTPLPDDFEWISDKGSIRRLAIAGLGLALTATGYSQSGASPNTNRPALAGPLKPAVPRIFDTGPVKMPDVIEMPAAFGSEQGKLTDYSAGDPLAPDIVPDKDTGFLARLKEFYIRDWNGTLPNNPTPAKRGLPFPLDSPPFPNADWGYGGSPDIGAPDENVYPLMTALRRANNKTKIYGWIEPGIDFSTSGHTNFPFSYNIYPNRLELDQAVVYIERLPNTIQNAHFDWGYHLSAFYGVDTRFTTAKGYFSQQLLLFNRQYGFDPVLEYVDLYFPVDQGMDVRFGRFLSVPGIEAQLAPNNYTYSHSLLYTIDPFTDTGIVGTVKLTDQWLVQLGLSASHDVAFWTSDRAPSAIACVGYTAKTDSDNYYVCANGINSGKYAYNNLQEYDGTWYHRLNKTTHIATEAWYMYERDVPNITGNVANPIKPEIGANGAFCLPGRLRCTAPEYAAVNYVEKEITPKLYLSFRSDFLDDKKGQRTGYATKYSENTLMLGKWIGSTVLFRPEIRFDRSYDLKAYDNGTHNNQLIFASDLIFKF